VLTPLTNDKNALKLIANRTSATPTSACPTPTSAGSCPLRHVAYTATQVTGTPTTIQGIDYGNITIPGYGTFAYRTDSNDCQVPSNLQYTSFSNAPCTPTYTGTKLPNAVTVTSATSYGYLWSTGNGGRNDDLGEGNARKVLVIMTDGQNEGYPAMGPQQDPTGWDAQFQTLASALKLGPDGQSTTPEQKEDDVEIYTIGFFCTPYESDVGSHCKSRLADDATPDCPGTGSTNYASLSTSAVDDLLKNVSSSTGTGCDHYFPLSKDDSLPAVFQQLAGTISRGALTD
jgi:hypothetical protein